jgi:CheY-like chemotaxis protein
MHTFNKPISILLVDDDKDDRFFFQEAFKEVKAETAIETLADGDQLIKRLNGTAKLPDLLFLDLNLPRKNGSECLQEIRSNDKWKELVVVIYSTSSSERDINETFSKGANLYIKKPNDFFSLIDIISHVMNINWKAHNSQRSMENYIFNIKKEE